MTIATTTNRVDAPGNGSATSFSFAPVVIFEASDLQVTVRDSSGNETSLVQGAGSANYSVSVSTYPGVGSITYPASGGSPLPTGSTIVIKRIVPLLQSVSLSNQGAYLPKIQEGEYDYLTAIDQQQQEQINRTMQLAVTDASVPVTFPTSIARAGQFLGFDGNGNPVAALPSGGGVPVSSAMQPFVASASTTIATGLLTFLQSGAGAITRFIVSKLRERVTPIDFGADPTGVADSTAAFNAALVASKAVWIDPGTYRITGVITMPQDGGVLQGPGVNSVVITSNQTTGNMITCAANLSVVTVGGFTLTRSVTATAGAGLAPVTINKMTIRNIRATAQYVGFALGACAAGTIENCVAEFNKSHGFKLQNDSTHNVLQWALSNNISQFNDGWGFAVVGTANTAGTSIALLPWQGCLTFANTGGGVILQGTNTAQLWDFSANGCFFGSDNFDEMYFDTYGGNHFVRGCSLELAGQVAGTGSAQATAATNTGNGVEITSNNQDVNVVGCLIQSVSYNGVLCNDNLFTAVTGCIITNVALGSGSFGGVINGGVGHITVTGSRIGSRVAGQTTQYGISVADGATLTAVGNDLRANSLGAIAITTNYNQANIAGNQGYVSRFGGQVTMTAGATSLVVSHFLTLAGGQTPTQINVTSLSALASGVQVWADTFTATTFTLHVSASNGSNTFFAFTACTSQFN